MSEMLPFEKFRLTHEDALRHQRETLRDEALAEEVLRAGDTSRGWSNWPDNVLAVES